MVVVVSLVLFFYDRSRGTDERRSRRILLACLKQSDFRLVLWVSLCLTPFVKLEAGFDWQVEWSIVVVMTTEFLIRLRFCCLLACLGVPGGGMLCHVWVLDGVPHLPPVTPLVFRA